MKKRRKALPLGISKHDGQILTKVKRRAYRLDMGLFSCCGIKFGWGSVIGLLPGIGDVIDAFMAMMVMRTAQQVEGGLPTEVKAMMLFNIIVDFGIGLVPFLGDIADALFRANTRNAVVLERHLRKKGAEALKAQGQPVPAVDPSDPGEFDRQVQEPGSPPEYAEGSSHAPAGISNAPAQNTKSSAGGSGGGFFGKKTKQPDVEHGVTQAQQPLGDKARLQKDRR